jgi:hypothetical protein
MTRRSTSSGIRTVRYTRFPFLGKLIKMTPGSSRNILRGSPSAAAPALVVAPGSGPVDATLLKRL